MVNNSTATNPFLATTSPVTQFVQTTQPASAPDARTSAFLATPAIDLGTSFVFIGWLGLAIYGTSIFLLYLNRKNQFLKARDPFWLYFLTALFLALNTLAAIYYQLRDSCSRDVLRSVFPFVLYIAVAAAYSVRLWTLSFKFAIAEEQIESFDMFVKFSRTSRKEVNEVPDSVIESSKGWYRRHQWMVHRWFSVFLICFISAVCTALSIYFSVIHVGSRCTTILESNEGSSLIRGIGYAVIFVIFAIANVINANRFASSEYFSQNGVLNEYYFVGLITLLYSAIMILAHFSTPDSKAYAFRSVVGMSDFLSVIYMFLLFLVSVMYPLLQCYTQVPHLEGDEDGLKPYAEHMKDLSSMLSTNSGFLCFRAFLAMEQELHKLLFVESVKAYKSAIKNFMNQTQTERNFKMLELALSLYDDFLSKGAPLMKDLPLDIISKVENSLPVRIEPEESKEGSTSGSSNEATDYDGQRRKSMQELCAETEILRNELKFAELPVIFDQAVDFVMADLSYNAFARFRGTILYQELELHARRNSLRRKSLVELKIM